MPDLSALNTRFGIPGRVIFSEGPGGLATVEVNDPCAHALLALQGAHLLDWTPAGAEPVIWLSPAAKFARGKAIRGGTPICWPWFGPHPTETTYPAHGFARTACWEVLSVECPADGGTRLEFRLIPEESVHRWWPHATRLEFHILVGSELQLTLLTKNIGTAPVAVGQALHTYFAVSDVCKVRLVGLEGLSYLDKVHGGSVKLQHGPVTFHEEIDRIYRDSVQDCIIVDPGLKRRLRIAKTGSRSTVVWNPWIQKSAKMDDFVESGYLGMVCVETANAADDIVTIEPGAEHRLGVVYSVEPFA